MNRFRYLQQRSTVVCSLLSVLVLLLCAPEDLRAEEGHYDYEISEEDGTVTITGYRGPGGELVIPDTLAGRIVKTIGRRAFMEKNQITSVTFPNTVTFIGRESFRDCQGLATIHIPESVEHIALPAFNRNRNIESFHVAEGNRFYRSVDGALFHKDMSAIRRFPTARSGEYVLPEGVTLIHDGAFSFATKLTSVVIPEGVTHINKGAFRGCESLTNVELPESLEQFSSKARIFLDCVSLKSIVIPDGVTSIPRLAFSGCVSLEDVTLPKNLKTIEGQAFMGCSSLKRIVIPAGVERLGGGRGAEVFMGCDNLTSVYFLGDAPKVTGPIFSIDSIDEPIGLELSHDLVDVPPTSPPLTVYRTKNAQGWPRPGERWMNVPTALFSPLKDAE